MKQQGFGAQHILSFSKIFLAESSVFKEENYDYPTFLGSELMTMPLSPTKPYQYKPVYAKKSLQAPTMGSTLVPPPACNF